MNKKLILVLLTLLLSQIVFASGNKEVKELKKDVNFLTIIDSKERTVTIKEEPLRVISLAPSVTETIFALNAGDKLIGRTDYCDYPSQVDQIDSIGTLYKPNIEKIVSLNPDLIIASTHFNDEYLIKLAELSITVVIVDNQANIQGVFKNITDIGLLLNREKESKKLVDSMEKKISEIQGKISGQPKPSVYYVVGYGEYGDYTAGGDTFISEMLTLAGGNNIAMDSKGWSYSLENIIEKNPSIFICSIYNNAKQGITEATGYKELSAIKEGNIFEVNNNIVDRQGPRIVQGLEALAKILHPQSF